MLCLIQSLLALVVFIGRDEFLVIQVLLALVIYLGLFQINVCQAHTHLSRRELTHIGNHLHFRNHLSLLHKLSGFFQQFGDDTRDLRLHVYLVARFDLTCDDSGLLDAVQLRCELVVDNFLGLALLPEEHERSDENQRDNRSDDQFTVPFHNYFVYYIFAISYFFASDFTDYLGLLLLPDS